MIKVVKFGGSSLAHGRNFLKVKAIVEADPSRCVVVVSAPGKRTSDDNKVTDLLYTCHAHLKYKVAYDDIWENIAARYREIATTCGLKIDVNAILAEVRETMTRHSSVDYIVSRGEYLNARLMAACLGYEFVDATRWLYFNFDGKVDYEKSYAALDAIVKETPRVVIPGFYGILPDGNVHTFSRGGSDVTGALAAAAVNAESYENWTDVSGIMMADPRIVENPKPIERVTFSELRELSYMGADVLHEETVFPVRQKSIPLYIKNTNDPEARGTLIMEDFEDEVEDDGRFITGITGKKHYTVISIHKNRMHDDLSFMGRVLRIAEKYQLTVEHIPSSVDCFSLVIASSSLDHCLHTLIADIREQCSPDSVKVSDGMSLVAVVGRRMASNAGASGKIFETIGRTGINIRMIEQGSDEISIIIGVMDSDFSRTIRTLYNSFT